MTEQDQKRLRSEVTPSGDRRRRVALNKVDCASRRTALCAQIRADLIAELGPNITTTQRNLVNAYALTVTEIQELGSVFLRASASEEQMQRLSAARGQLARLLGLLGLPKAQARIDGGPPPNASPEELRTWSRGYVERVLNESRDQSSKAR